MTPEQQLAVEKYKEAVQAHEDAGDEMVEAFSYFKVLVAEGKFEDAKNYLRPMPFSAYKTLAFRSILVAEEQWNGH